MMLTRNHKVLIALSAVLAMLYIIVPTISDPKMDYGNYADLVDIASFAYVLVLPAAIGIAAALIIQGSVSTRLIIMTYSLGPCILIGLLVWGATGGIESVRVGMILLASTATLLLVAGAITAAVNAAARRHSPRT